MNCILAEDDGIIRLLISKYLQQEGLKILDQTSNGKKTIIKVKELKPDIVFLDINMDYRTDGIDCAKELNKTYPDIKIIFMSAYPKNTFKKELTDVNYIDYIEKPVTSKKINDSLKKIN
jgi:two-component SAPR family response regulator